MGQKNCKGTVSITEAGNRIRLRWRFQNERYSLNLFQFSQINLVHARKIASQIETNIVFEQFDTSLLKYQPISESIKPGNKSLVQHFEDWARIIEIWIVIETSITMKPYPF